MKLGKYSTCRDTFRTYAEKCHRSTKMRLMLIVKVKYRPRNNIVKSLSYSC